MAGRIFAVLILTALACSAARGQGDTLDMSAAANGRFDAPGKPTRGMSQERVRAEYGQPQSTDAAVGEPPISRWHYADFVVYFEHNMVIHAVNKR